MPSVRRNHGYADEVSKPDQDAPAESPKAAVKMFGDQRSALLTDRPSTTRRDVVEETVNGELVKMFGGPRPAVIARGPDRRVNQRRREPFDSLPFDRVPSSAAPVMRAPTTTHAVRLGGGDSVAEIMWFLGILVLIATVMFGTLILVNARIGTDFSNSWNSNRVAIGLTVFTLGAVHGALLIGVSRAITYHRAAFRLLSQVADQQKNANW